LATRRLYWEDPNGRSFTGRILRLSVKDGKLAVLLDRTLFHPEGGGQPCDTGHLSVMDSGLSAKLGLSDLAVSGVVEEGGEIAHLCESGSLGPGVLGGLPDQHEGGWPVQGVIDWSRRFDFMQQHTGQHILSRAFEEVLEAGTVGFHLARDYVSIDLASPSVSPQDVARVEDRANQVVFEDVPVTGREYIKGELPQDLRSRFAIQSESVRVVYVGDFDTCPCGGTHVTSSGQVGLIKVNQTDRAHGGVRVVFGCGGRALADYRDKQELLDETARLLSQPAQAVPDAARELIGKLQDLQKRLEEAQETLLVLEIEALLKPDTVALEKSIVAVLPGKSPDQLKYAAKQISEKSGKLTVCLSREPRFSAVVASPASGPDARSVVATIAAAWGGRGGGTRDMAQLGSKEPLGAADETVEDDVKRICRKLVRV
jgi:alanyl-tRNA synthetase